MQLSDKDKVEWASSISRFTVAFIWVYHGLVPKLWLQHATELKLIRNAPLPIDPDWAMAIAGMAEVILGCWIMVYRNSLLPIYFSIAAFLVLLSGAAATTPDVLGAAFNPVSLSVAAIALGCVHIVLKKSSSNSD